MWLYLRIRFKFQINRISLLFIDYVDLIFYLRIYLCLIATPVESDSNPIFFLQRPFIEKKIQNVQLGQNYSIINPY